MESVATRSPKPCNCKSTNLVAPLCVRHQILHFFHVLVWRVIPNSVWDIEGRSTSLNHGAQHLRNAMASHSS